MAPLDQFIFLFNKEQLELISAKLKRTSEETQSMVKATIFLNIQQKELVMRLEATDTHLGLAQLPVCTAAVVEVQQLLAAPSGLLAQQQTLQQHLVPGGAKLWVTPRIRELRVLNVTDRGHGIYLSSRSDAALADLWLQLQQTSS